MAHDRLTTLFGWLHLLRLPILLTAPGGVVAGYAFVSDGFAVVDLGVLWITTLAATLAMAGGFLLNDWRDRHRDELDRPEHPIPSGAVSPGASLGAGILCLVLAAGSALAVSMPAGMLAGGLVLLTILHAVYLRRLPVIGSLSVGVLYAVPLLMGAAAADSLTEPAMVFVWLAAFLSLLYAAGAAALWRRAANERLPARGTLVQLGVTPLLILLTGLEGIFGGGWTCLGLWVIWALFTYTTLHLVRTLWKVETARRAFGLLGYLLRSLILMQAYWIAASGASCFMVASVLVLWPAAGFLSRQM